MKTRKKRKKKNRVFYYSLDAVQVGKSHVLIQTKEGKWWGFGSNNEGQLIDYNNEGKNTFEENCVLREPKEMELKGEKIHQCFTHLGFHSFYLTNNGVLYASGKNSHGQLGIGEISAKVSVPCKVSFFEDYSICRVKCGYSHTIIVAEKGNQKKQLFGMGQNNHGELGIGTYEKEVPEPSLIPLKKIKKIKMIDAGQYYTVVMFDNGKVFTCGENKDGRLGQGDKKKRSSLSLIEYFKNKNIDIIKISAGIFHCICLSNVWKVYGFGCNTGGELGINNKVNQVAPMNIKSLNKHKIVDIYASYGKSCFITEENRFFFCGKNLSHSLAILGDQSFIFLTPLEVTMNEGLKLEFFRGGMWFNVFIANHGKVYTSGENGYGQLGINNKKQNEKKPTRVNIGRIDIHSVIPKVFTRDFSYLMFSRNDVSAPFEKRKKK